MTVPLSALIPRVMRSIRQEVLPGIDRIIPMHTIRQVVDLCFECIVPDGWGKQVVDLRFKRIVADGGNEKNPLSNELRGFIYPGTGLSSRAVTHQVLSLLTVFTFVFGMGTGVFRPHQHQEPVRDAVLVMSKNRTLKTAIENVVFLASSE
jgi:hypothetical protein